MSLRYSLWAAAALVAAAWTAAAQGTSATIIGNDTYTTLSNLPGVVNDNTTAQNAFASCGINSQLARNQTAAQMSNFVSVNVPQVPNDTWIFKYSGHGDNFGGAPTGSMLGVGSDGATPPSDSYTPQQFVMDATTQHPLCRIVILDSCGSGQFIQTADALFQAQAIQAVFFSATRTGSECAYCSPGLNPQGYFTSAFMTGMMGAADGCIGGFPDGVVTAAEVDCYLTNNYDTMVPQDPNLRHRYIPNGLGNKVLWTGPVSTRELSWGRVKAGYQ